ncbi:hypothetical protein [Psychroserpens mesophilus]|uniref:hypothetical protein n=1 Tax=Psychroserpens mesophilus TaxID=325473 RepID=UPI003D653EE0
MDNQNDIIKKEIEGILDDIKALYNKSGKRASGKFETLLEAKYGVNKAEIFGATYLAGRSSGKMPPIQEIKKWIESKGIKSVKDKISSTGLAWAIAKKIAKNGTNKANQLKVYEQVITPERIDSIIKKVSEFNVNLFVNEIETSLELLEKNI